jgi:hypothetical protein
LDVSEIKFMIALLKEFHCINKLYRSRVMSYLENYFQKVTINKQFAKHKWTYVGIKKNKETSEIKMIARPHFQLFLSLSTFLSCISLWTVRGRYKTTQGVSQHKDGQ